VITIGVDAGSSVVKAVAFDGDGGILATASHAVPISHPAPGLSEQDIEETIALVLRTIAECAGVLPDTPGLLAITAQGDGIWLTDQHGFEVRPAILWSDTRASHFVDDWFGSGVAPAAFRRSGNAPFSGSAAALLRWLEIEEPRSLDRAATAGYCKDILFQRLTGLRLTDLSDASLPFLDIRSREYDEELVDLFRVRRWRHMLAPVSRPGETIAPLSAEAATATGLPANLPVHAGPFDFPATCIGAGLNRPGDGVIALGTTLACGVLVSRIDTSGEPSGMTLATAAWDRWIRLLPAMAGMAALDWFLPLIGAGYGDLDGMLRSARPGSGGVLALPIFSSSGERAPFVDAGARGRIIGLGSEARREDLARAVCEGMAYTARHCLEIGGLAPDGEVILCGGGSRSVAFRQLLADVLGRPVLLGRQPETGARGAAIAALEAADEPIDRERWTAPDGKTHPDPASRNLYNEGFRRYREELGSARGRWSGPTL
jgi:erythritol kinase (D-erythritol 1-phosphate-forming)